MGSTVGPKLKELVAVYWVVTFVTLIGAFVWLYQFPYGVQLSKITNFEECVKAGNPIAQSFPRQCTADGNTFFEMIDLPSNYKDLIEIKNLSPYQSVVSPIYIEGRARGLWFFEASFPVNVFDVNGNRIGGGIAQAQGDWMTTDYVDFLVWVTFADPTTKMGIIEFRKDNPSGLSELEDSYLIPVSFSIDQASNLGSCFVGGCSSEICSDNPNAVSVCEYRDEYSCYQDSVCERQGNGQCGWTPSSELKACLSSASEITSFDECVKAGNPILESFPRQCRANGETFVDDNELNQ